MTAITEASAGSGLTFGVLLVTVGVGVLAVELDDEPGEMDGVVAPKLLDPLGPHAEAAVTTTTSVAVTARRVARR